MSMMREFTSKERDAETGLDYFKARYFSGAQGRFTSPDPLDANLIRVLNPQRWNKYAYVVNNPLAFTDPDGKDAIAVSFKTLAVHAGHAAVVSVHSDGSATFGSYGPSGGSKPVWTGEYVVQPLQTKVTFGSDGTPTTGSFSVLAGEVADLEKVDPSSVDMAYYKTSDAETAALDQYLKSLVGRKDLYVVGFHDCIEICNNALHQAGIGRGSQWLDIPRTVLWMYSFTSDSTYSGATGEKKQNDRKRDKPDVHSTIHFCTKENDSSCQQ
jgi:RHS repeat-associated protein